MVERFLGKEEVTSPTLVCGSLFMRKQTKETRKNEIGNTLIFIAILDFVFYCSSLFIMYGYRMSYFFLPHYIYLIPKIDKDLKDHKGRSTYRIFICIAFIVYWYYRYVKIGYDGTIPYIFYWK